MRKREGIVEMKRVDDIVIRKRLKLEKPADTTPIRPCGNDCMQGRALTDGRDDLLLHDKPIGLSTIEYRLVYHLKEKHIRVDVLKLGGERAPENRESTGP